MNHANYIDTQIAANEALAAFNEENSVTSNPFLELFKLSVANDAPYATTSIESASQEIPQEILHYENIELVFEDHEEELRYIAMSEISGRPLPHALVLDAFEIGIDDNALDSPAIHSASSDLRFSDAVNLAINLIDQHFDYYGSMFSREMQGDIHGMSHLQSAFLVKSYSTPRPHLFTPIMGINALSIALERIAISRDSDVEVGNIFAPTKVKNDPESIFSFDYVGHVALLPREHFVDAVFLSDHIENEDFYVEEQAAYGVNVTLSCIQKDELPDFETFIDENPFQWIGAGHQGIPSVWSSLVHNHFADNIDFEVAAKACISYPDVFAFWLAASSGLSMSAFSSFNGTASDFHDLSVEDKSAALFEMMPLVEHISLKMQNNAFLLQTPLINLYEL